MTFTIRSERVRDLQVYMEQDKFSPVYKVGISKTYESGYGRILDQRVYPTKEKAQRRFRSLLKDAEAYRWG